MSLFILIFHYFKPIFISPDASIKTTSANCRLAVPRKLDTADYDAPYNDAALCALHQAKRREACLQMGSRQDCTAAASVRRARDSANISRWIPIAVELRRLLRSLSSSSETRRNCRVERESDVHEHREKLADRRRQISLRHHADLLPRGSSRVSRTAQNRFAKKIHHQSAVRGAPIYLPTSLLEDQEGRTWTSDLRERNVGKTVS